MHGGSFGTYPGTLSLEEVSDTLSTGGKGSQLFEPVSQHGEPLEEVADTLSTVGKGSLLFEPVSQHGEPLEEVADTLSTVGKGSQLRHGKHGPILSERGCVAQVAENRRGSQHVRGGQEVAASSGNDPVYDPSPVLPGVVARDARQEAPGHWSTPVAKAKGEFRTASLMRPGDLARRILPCKSFDTLERQSREGVPTQCGPSWPQEVVEQAMKAGPHDSALTDENIALIWSDIESQRDMGGARESKDFTGGDCTTDRPAWTHHVEFVVRSGAAGLSSERKTP
jgi:hypothetical protein